MKPGMAEKQRNFYEFFPKFQSLIARLLSQASKKHENVLKNVSYNFEIIRIFLGAAVDEKTAAQKPKKSINFCYPLSVFFYISQTTTARRLRFSPID
jgi:hypothetical protein